MLSALVIGGAFSLRDFRVIILGPLNGIGQSVALVSSISI